MAFGQHKSMSDWIGATMEQAVRDIENQVNNGNQGIALAGIFMIYGSFQPDRSRRLLLVPRHRLRIGGIGDV